MKYLLSLLFLSASALAAPPVAPHNAVVLLYVNTDDGRIAGGTGFEVESPSGLIFTISNAHVCALSKTGYMTARSQARDEEYAGVRILGIDVDNDLCALLPIPHPRPLHLGAAPHPQQNIVILGHPMLEPLTLSQGYITTMEAGEFVSTARVMPGNSGSPVMDARTGLVVGVVHAYDVRDRTSVSINVEMLRYFLRNLVHSQ